MLNERPIDFDRFVRIIFSVGVLVALYFLLQALSSVLIPFFLAWLTAYLLNPLVRLVQKMIRKRTMAVLFTLFSLFVLFVATLILVIPSILEEVLVLQGLLSMQLDQMSIPSWVPAALVESVGEYLRSIDIKAIVSSEGVADKALQAFNGVWGVFANILGALGAAFGIVTYLLYLVFIMLDYDYLSGGWTDLIPAKYKAFVTRLVSNMEVGMNGYFKAQTKIVLIVAFLFAVGFKLVGLPFAIVLGLFVGLLNYVPYLQLVGIIPALGLVGLLSLKSGESFVLLAALTLGVFVVVQLIQDILLTPKFMGGFSGLNPAIILLSLSIWGSLLGIIGLIVAIPLTSLLLAYYKNYILESK